MDITAYIQSGQIESYVLGLTNAQEAAELELMMQQHPEIKLAVAEFEIQLEKAAFENAVTPKASAKDSLFSLLATEFAAPATVSKVVNIKELAPVRSMIFLRYASIAAVFLLVASTFLNVYLYKKYDDSEAKYRTALLENKTLTAQNDVIRTGFKPLLQDSAFNTILLSATLGNEGKLATVYWDAKSKDVYLMANKMPKLEKGKQYQLWAIVDDKPVDAGVIADCTGLCKMKNIPKASMFAITIEKEGGSQAPTLTAMVVAGKV